MSVIDFILKKDRCKWVECPHIDSGGRQGLESDHACFERELEYAPHKETGKELCKRTFHVTKIQRQATPIFLYHA